MKLPETAIHTMLAFCAMQAFEKTNRDAYNNCRYSTLRKLSSDISVLELDAFTEDPFQSVIITFAKDITGSENDDIKQLIDASIGSIASRVDKFCRASSDCSIRQRAAMQT